MKLAVKQRKKVGVWLLLLLLVLCVAVTVFLIRPQAQTTRILLLGDSITEGRWRDGRTPYRLPLWARLQHENYAVDFVGSSRSFYRGPWPFAKILHWRQDHDHEGHWGWEAGEILESLPHWLTTYRAEIVLLHLGSNDIDRGQSVDDTIAEINDIIALLREQNNSVSILLAQIIPIRGVDVTAFNHAIERLATNLNSEASAVVVVDHYTGYDASALNYDKYHPNEMGSQRMADRWFETLQAFLPAPAK